MVNKEIIHFINALIRRCSLAKINNFTHEFKFCSFDRANGKHLVSSNMHALNFDKITTNSLKLQGRQSVDCLSASKNMIHLIEFKNGKYSDEKKQKKLQNAITKKINDSQATIFGDLKVDNPIGVPFFLP